MGERGKDNGRGKEKGKRPIHSAPFAPTMMPLYCKLGYVSVYSSFSLFLCFSENNVKSGANASTQFASAVGMRSAPKLPRAIRSLPTQTDFSRKGCVLQDGVSQGVLPREYTIIYVGNTNPCKTQTLRFFALWVGSYTHGAWQLRHATPCCHTPICWTHSQTALSP